MKQNKFFTKQIILVLTILLSGMNSFQTVTVIDATDKYDNIDGLKSRWYKIKLAEGQYGWVYGGRTKSSSGSLEVANTNHKQYNINEFFAEINLNKNISFFNTKLKKVTV